MADQFIIPEVGSSGVFVLRSPFDGMVDKNVRYTCQAVRRISDYQAQNEDVKTDIYDLYQLPEADYLADMESDSFIASLQGETGQWLYVPVRYIVSYPEVNGIPYRTMTLAVALPGIQANLDLSNLIASIKNVVKDTLGVDSNVGMIETSKVTQVPSDKHETIVARRNMVIGTPSTDSARLSTALRQLEEMKAYTVQLENYITANVPVPDQPPAPAPTPTPTPTPSP